MRHCFIIMSDMVSVLFLFLGFSGFSCGPSPHTSASSARTAFGVQSTTKSLNPSKFPRMADALVSIILERLTSPITGEIEQEVKLLLGARKEVEKLIRTFNTIRAVLNDAEKREAKEEAVQTWLDELKDASYDMDDALDEWRTAILKSKKGLKNSPWPKMQVFWSLSPCLFQVFLRHNIAHMIKDVNERLDEIVEKKNNFHFTTVATAIDVDHRPKTTSLIDISEVRARGWEKAILLRSLLETSSEIKQHPPVISIVGMGGIGKTTLAQLAYNDSEVMNHFEHRIWVCVSDPFDLNRIARAILEGIVGSIPNIFEIEGLSRHILEKTKNKKLLIVLDDVWTEKFAEWEPLRKSLIEVAQGSRILVTTRSVRVSKMMGSSLLVSLQGLAREECWLIFSQLAFFERSKQEVKDLEGIGWGIVDRCKGLPLAAKVLGGLMRFKSGKQQWQNVLDSDLWDLEEAKEGIISPLWLSYHNLPSAIKRCLLYCAVFPKDHDIRVEDLIKLWMANGFISTKSGQDMEVKGQEYIDNLAMRCFLQPVSWDTYTGEIKGCTMHDIVHDFVQSRSKNECCVVDMSGDLSMTLPSGKLRHSSFIIHEGGSSSKSLEPVLRNFNIKGLHTLLVSGQREASPSVIKAVLTSLLVGKVARLRALALHVDLEEVPKEVGNLIHLRYLEVSSSSLKALPDTVCNLINLQTLDLNDCLMLEKLPRCMDKLINLRHLEMDGAPQLRGLPKGVGQLSNLQTLSHFIISPNNNDDREGKYWCKVGDLQKLNLLRGILHVSGLGNVGDAAEAERAELKKKERLQHLILRFDVSESIAGAEGEADDVIGVRRDLAVIEALEPTSQLVSLWIGHYRGSRLPRWITSLSKLRDLGIADCPNLTALPPDFPRLRLEKMTVGHCPFLAQRLGRNRDGVDAPLVSHIPDLQLSKQLGGDGKEREVDDGDDDDD